MSHRRVAAVVIGAVVVSASGGWIAASRIRSPAEIAARSGAPDASPILVAAEERTVSTDVVTRGTARFGSPQQLTTAPSALKPGLVTAVPAPGTELTEGSVVITATGRPVFLLTGDRLGLRDLGPGLEGDDVRQLEEALARLGFDPLSVDRVYDAGTERAVAAWYSAAGFPPFEATEEQLASIRAREADLALARVDLSGARDNVASQQAELAAARAAHADALASYEVSPLAVAAAEADANAMNQAAQAEVAANAAALNELLADKTASPQSIVVARAQLAAAQANATSTARAGEQLVAEAIAGAKSAAAALARPRRPSRRRSSASRSPVARSRVRERMPISPRRKPRWRGVGPESRYRRTRWCSFPGRRCG